jgi:precorrin-6Y C5,15-methyltransferase (decarboxylating)
MSTERVAVVGLHGGAWFGAAAEEVLRKSDLLVGAARQHEDLASAGLPGEAVELWGRMDEIVELCATQSAAGRRVCVLSAGDPGFFGIVRVLADRLGRDALDVHPAPSSISLAFARVGIPWDDAVIASCHGRPLEHAVAQVLGATKAAVLVSKDSPPQALGAALVAAGCGRRDVWVCTRLAEREESVTATDLDGLATGTFDPLSVVVLAVPDAHVADAMQVAWGADDDTFAHDAGMITKAEVRAVALGKLSLPRTGVLWDVGAGSGSVAVEAARLAPGLRVFAIERDAAACERIRANATGTAVTVVEGSAPDALAALPAPDRAFVGGGGPAVLDAVCDRLAEGGRVVATSTILTHATHAADRLGSVVQLAVSRGVPIGPDGALRLAAENPIFVAWGPA